MILTALTDLSTVREETYATLRLNPHTGYASMIRGKDGRRPKPLEKNTRNNVLFDTSSSSAPISNITSKYDLRLEFNLTSDSFHATSSHLRYATMKE